MKKIETIVWDFDGTQAKTCDSFVKVGHSLVKRYLGFDFTEEDVEYLRGLSAKEVAKAFFTCRIPSLKHQTDLKSFFERYTPNFRLRWKIGISLPRMLKEGLRKFHEERESIEPYDGIVDIIKDLSSQDYENITLTSNRKETVHQIYNRWNLHCVEIYHCTTFLGLPSLFGKENKLKRIMRERGLRRHRGDPRKVKNFRGHSNGMWKYDTNKIIYIGDEARDVHACQKLGIPMLGVTWGLNNESALIDAGLDAKYLIHSPYEIPMRIEELEKS